MPDSEYDRIADELAGDRWLVMGDWLDPALHRELLDTARARARHRGHGDALARAHADAREALRVEAAKHEAIAGRVEAARREAARRRAARDEP